MSSLRQRIKYYSYYGTDLALRGLGVENGLRRRIDQAHKELRKGQRRRANAAERFFDRLGTINRRAGRLVRRGVIAGGRKVRTAAKATWKAIDRMRTTANFGHTAAEDYNRRLPGFHVSMAEYDAMIAEEHRQKVISKEKVDREHGLGLATRHSYYNKTELAMGAANANIHYANAIIQHNNAVNAHVARARAAARSNRKKNAQAVRNTIKRQIQNGTLFEGLDKMNDRIQTIKTVSKKPCLQAMVDVAEAALITNTPRASGKLVRSITKDVGTARATLFYDREKADYALHVDRGTSKMSARNMIRKTVNQVRSQCRNAGVQAHKGAIKVA